MRILCFFIAKQTRRDLPSIHIRMGHGAHSVSFQILYIQVHTYTTTESVTFITRMPCPRFYGYICRSKQIVDRLSYAPGSEWDSLTREQQGELTKRQAQIIARTLEHKPLRFEHPDTHEMVKHGEVLKAYVDKSGDLMTVFEINDGNPASLPILADIRAGRLKGLSLGHDTLTGEGVEVSIVQEGFRPGTTIEGEMQHAVVGVAGVADNDHQPQSKGGEYIDIDDPSTDTVESVVCVGAPRIINASIMSSSSSYGARGGGGNNGQFQSRQQPRQQQPQENDNNYYPSEEDNTNNNNNRQQRQFPSSSSSSSSNNNNGRSSAPPQQPQPPKRDTNGGSNNNEGGGEGDEQQDSSSSSPPASNSNGLSGEAQTKIMERLMRSNMNEGDKNVFLQYATELNKALKTATKKNTALEAENQVSKKQFEETARTHAKMVEILIQKAGLAAETSDESESLESLQKLAVKDPHAYMSKSMPRLMAASARLQSSSSSSSASSRQQQQQQQERVEPPVRHYDYRAFDAFQAALHDDDDDNDSGNQRYHNHHHGAYNRPQRMEASNKRSRHDGGGGGAWYSTAKLMPGARAIFEETEAASRSGFGMSTRLLDNSCEEGPRKLQQPPSAAEMAQFGN